LGGVYAESPLFEIRTKDKTYFAYTDKEKNEIVSKLKGNTPYCVQKDLAKMIPI